MTSTTYIIRDPQNGYAEAQVGTDDLAYHLASFGARADLFQVEYDPATRNMVSANITRDFVLMAIREGWLNQDDEITHIYYDWPVKFVLGDQEYYRTEKGLVEA